MPDTKDERGFALNHEGRVRSAVQKIATATVSLRWCECTLRGHASVGSIALRSEEIVPCAVTNVLEYLNRSGWDRGPEEILYSGYDSYRAEVWFDHQQGWLFMVIDRRSEKPAGGYAGFAENLSDAQKQAAARIASLVGPTPN